MPPPLLRGAPTQSLSLRTTGHKKNCFTVCLAVKADGTKMKPYIVIPVKKVKKELMSILGVIVVVTPNGWMNECLTSD